jgi:hypothetical protein
MREGCSAKPSARATGVGKQVEYRWLRESFTALRGRGLTVDEAQASLGFFTAAIAATTPATSDQYVDRSVRFGDRPTANTPHTMPPSTATSPT